MPSLVLLVLAVGAAPLQAAPHPHGVGDGVIRLRATTLVANSAYDDNGARVDHDPFAMTTMSAQAEAGVAPHLTLYGVVPAVWLPPRAPAAGDMVLGGLLSVLAPGGPVDVALSLDVKVPLYEGRPAIRGRDRTGTPVIGDGQIDVTAASVFVANLPLGGALDLYAGYRLRTGGVTDAAIGGGRIGAWLFDRRFFVSALLDTVVTFDAAPASDEIVGRGWAAFGPKVSVRLFERSFLDVSALYVGRGTNAVGGVELGFGLSTAL